MAGQCEMCGKVMGYMDTPSPSYVDLVKRLRASGHDISLNSCLGCINGKLSEIKRERSYTEFEGNLVETYRESQKIKVYTVEHYPAPYESIGVVTAHVVLGTGPITEFLGGMADLLGMQSETYNEKITEAEMVCLSKLRGNAYRMRADAIIGIHITYTELTHISGMLLVCMAGTAIKNV